MKQIRRFLLSVLNTILDIIYPRSCYLCKKTLPENYTCFCLSCLRKLPLIKYTICQRCGSPLGQYISFHASCNICKNKYFSFAGLRYAGYYEDGLRQLLLDLKFNRQYHIAMFLGRILANHLKKYPFRHSPDAVLAVPMHLIDEQKRGYNQSELIAKVVAKQLKLPLINNLLYQTNKKEKQSSLPENQRHQNVLNVFSVNSKIKNYWKGKTLLLIDDIFTTGSTANECSKVLKKNGIKRVYVATIARTKKI